MRSKLKDIFTANRRGERKGVYAVCTVNRYAIQSALQQARRDQWPVLIETTAQQVNPSGGYSGMTPSDFAVMVYREAAAVGLDPGWIVLGGDHVGLHPWAALPASRAMDEARRLVQALVVSGFVKLHIDPTAPCLDDPREADGSLPMALIVCRTIDLMATAEETAHREGIQPPQYVIGSDVPAPGGVTDMGGRAITSAPTRICEVVAATRHALNTQTRAAVWPRVVAVVARTGADFSSRRVQPYDAVRTLGLVQLIDTFPGLVYEAHSTDFQSLPSLQAMMANHFAILKVGPYLTYTFREAVFHLARIEKQMLEKRKTVDLSRMIETMEATMVEDPRHWQLHYRGSEEELKWLRFKAYSDRIRYYWSYPHPAAALQRLVANLRRYPPPRELIAEYLPAVSRAIADGGLSPEPEALIRYQIGAVIDRYATACGARD